ncbi:Zinc/iron permease [Earliella scabrosa]|nr:Zinc/iron permease [Earliella scabrosa]
MSFFGNATGKLPQRLAGEGEDEGTVERVLIMLLIFAVSLFAVSFPTITATFRSIRVPSILFFVGKHFGTGVILSTAFVHLLQDAFKALLKPIVNERWKVGDWAGMIVLGSLLCIFLIEYVSTAYVDRLQSYPSLPSTPTASEPSSSAASVQMEYEPSTVARPSIVTQRPTGTENWIDGLPSNHPNDPFDERVYRSSAPRPLAPPERSSETNESTPLHPAASEVPAKTASYGATSKRSSNRPPARPSNRVSAPPGDAFFSGGHHRHESRDTHATHHARVSRWRWLGLPWWGGDRADVTDSDLTPTISRTYSHPNLRTHSHGHSHSHSHAHTIATLPLPVSTPKSSTSGKSRIAKSPESDGHGRGSGHHGHAHMDMERWMHDIDGEDGDGHGHMHDGVVDEECGAEPGEQEAETKVGRRRQVIGILVLQLGIMIHSLVIGLTLSITTGSEFTSLVIAIVFHQLFEGLSLGIRIAGLPSSHSEHGFRYLPGRTLKPLLAITFATTTPLGIGIGLATLGAGSRKGPHLILVQGIMSAVSAGMLIYAACVEMLAGDFVMDAHLWRSSVRRQVVALGSLVAGVCAMAAIGLD